MKITSTPSLLLKINTKEVDEAYQELEKQHAKLYLEMMHTEKRETTEARLKWACEKYLYAPIYFLLEWLN